MTERGNFIVLGGIGGCGKTTQVRMLTERLEASGVPAFATREHTRHLSAGSRIEEVIKRHQPAMDPLALQLMYVADRRDHFKQEIEPALEKGRLVICDRYYETTVAYAEEKWRPTLLKLNQELVARPDLTFIVRVSVAEGLRRNRMEERDIFDREESLKRCSLGYEWFLAHSGDESVVVDGERDPEVIHQEIYGEIQRRGLVGK